MVPSPKAIGPWLGAPSRAMGTTMLRERARRALGIVCAVISVATCAAPPTSVHATFASAAPVTNAVSESQFPIARTHPRSAEWLGDVLVYPPRSGAAKAPVALMLH